MNNLSKLLPFVVVGVAMAITGLFMLPRSDAAGDMNLGDFAKIPVADRGRVKPWDTVARINLLIINGGQSVVDDKDKPVPPVRWLLEVMATPLEATKYKMFRIENEEVQALLDLPKRQGLRYSLNEFGKQLPKLFEQAALADEVPAKQRTVFQHKVIETGQHAQIFLKLAKGEIPYAIPPVNGGDGWRPPAVAANEAMAKQFDSILAAFASKDVSGFNSAVSKYAEAMDVERSKDVSKAAFEAFFNRLSPFFLCAIFSIAVFFLACMSWVTGSDAFRRSAFWLAVFTVFVATVALIGRMYITNRWFVMVTNLYSSAIFIGWGCIIFGLVLEYFHRIGIGVAVAGVTGFLSLFIAHGLSYDGDTMEVLTAVLDTNFWLATHVTAVTTGYTATIIAGFLGIAYVLGGLLTTALTKDVAKALYQMIYGIVCFGLLFSFVGTVLGGLWADYSWGRFWGWDPKENGALIIVLWNGLVLHARWAGMVKGRGMAVLAIFGNIVTSWSWFGTNMLGVGLHAYASVETSRLMMLIAFVSLNLILIGIGMIPLRYWASFAPQARPKEPEPRDDDYRQGKIKIGSTKFRPGTA